MPHETVTELGQLIERVKSYNVEADLDPCAGRTIFQPRPMRDRHANPVNLTSGTPGSRRPLDPFKDGCHGHCGGSAP